MKEIKLTKGLIALVDDQDFEWLNQWKWCYSHGYAQTRGLGRKVYMHRLLAGEPVGRQVDHRNLNTLDNTRGNLRVGSPSDNQHNRTINHNNTSGYKNISKVKRGWQVNIMSDYKQHRKHFADLAQAISYRDLLIGQLHGEFARTEKTNG